MVTDYRQCGQRIAKGGHLQTLLFQQQVLNLSTMIGSFCIKTMYLISRLTPRSQKGPEHRNTVLMELGVPPSWHMDVFANLEAPWTPGFRLLKGRFHPVGTINGIICHWWLISNPSTLPRGWEVGLQVPSFWSKQPAPSWRSPVISLEQLSPLSLSKSQCNLEENKWRIRRRRKWRSKSVYVWKGKNRRGRGEWKWRKRWAGPCPVRENLEGGCTPWSDCPHLYLICQYS